MSGILVYQAIADYRMEGSTTFIKRLARAGAGVMEDTETLIESAIRIPQSAI